MSLRLVARKEFADAVQSRLLWGIVAAFVGVAAVIALAVSGGDDATGVDFLVFFGAFGGELVVPVVALVVGYSSVVGERESGSLLVLHGLPHSRRDVVLGKLLSRLAVVTLAVVAAFVAATALSLALFDSVPVGQFARFGLLTVLLGAAFVGVGVGISAASASRGRAMAAAIGSYFLFELLWEPLAAGVHFVVEGSLAGLTAPGWYLLLKRLSPISAYNQAANAMLDGAMPRLIGWYNIVEDVPTEAVQAGDGLAVATRVAGDVPVYLADWTVGLVFVGWLVVGTGVGYWRFRRADLV